MADELELQVKAFWDQQPHPLAPSLRIADFATAVKVATKIKFGGHASAAEAALFWPQFLSTGMSPQEFEHVVDRIAPLSFTYHGRPPSLEELKQLREKSPKEARTYFADLPDKHYPHVSAGDMVKTLISARPHAEEHLQRMPNKFEAAYLHHSGEHPQNYYQRMAADREAKQQPPSTLQTANVLQAPFGGYPGDSGVAPSGRPQTDQRDTAR